MGDIDWLVFELEGTLIDDVAAVRAGAELLARSHTAPRWASARGFRERWREALELSLVRYRRGECTEIVARRETVRVFDPRLEDGECDGLFRGYFERYLDALGVFPDVPSALFRIGHQVRLGVIAQADDARAKEMVRRVGLSDVISHVVGWTERPDRSVDPFEYFLKEVSGIGERIAFVGGELTEEVMAARRRGVRVVWLNRRFHRRSPELPTVRSLDELVEIFWPYMRLSS
jgi:FMN phosphatase YigB (HAD superfamily)